MNTGLCPKCDATISDVRTENVVLGAPPYEQWNGVSYICPKCSYVLGIQMDPIALRHDIVKMVLAGLRKK